MGDRLGTQRAVGILFFVFFVFAAKILEFFFFGKSKFLEIPKK
jgi:hypothetical protein